MQLEIKKECFRMEIICISDTHYESDVIRSILAVHPKCAYYFHCGDSQLQANHEILQQFMCVRGNTDTDHRFVWDQLVNVDCLDILITHGHRYQVNWNLEELHRQAKYEGVQMVCFGHTHVPLCKVYKEVIFINPGSALFPRGKYPFGTYVKISINCKARMIQVYFYRSDTHEVVDEQIVYI